MKIGVNYLLESKELFEEGKIDFVDYFKLYSINEDLSGVDWCKSHGGLMFHGIVGKPSFFCNKDLIKGTDIEKTKELLDCSIMPYISVHISSNEDNTVEGYINNIKENVIEYRKVFNKNIIGENIPYREYRNAYKKLTNPEIISKIVYDNDIKYLFDISHARSAANHYNMTLDEYVSKLPMDKCVEVHLAGMFTFPDTKDEEVKKKYTQKQLDLIDVEVKRFSNRKADNHGKLNEEDYDFLTKLLKKYENIEYITLEYGSYNDYIGYDDRDFVYPVCSFTKVSAKAKEEVLEQLLRIKEIVNTVENER